MASGKLNREHDKEFPFVYPTLHKLMHEITPVKKLQKLAIKADRILKEELKRECIKYTLAEARAIDIRTVGVQGDKRTYYYTIEINLYNGQRFIWAEREKFLEKLSSRITNEVKGVNRVIYTTGKQSNLYNVR